MQIPLCTLPTEDQMTLFSFLTTTLPNYSLAEICLTVIEQIRRREEQQSPNNEKHEEESDTEVNDEQFLQVPQSKWLKDISPQRKRSKFEEQRYISKVFCEQGIDYHKVLQQYPTMTPKVYRCYVEAINNQTVNEIVNYLRYECNVQIEKLNRDQKRSMRTQLTKIREWLGNRDLQQLQIYYKFVRRHYDKSIEVTFEDALKLYKTLIQIIRSPYVNVLDAEEVLSEAPKDSQSNEPAQDDQRAVIIQYLKSKDLFKVSDSLCQSNGYSLKWSIHSIKQMLRRLLSKAMKKLEQTLQKSKRGAYSYFFTQDKLDIFQSKASIGLQAMLLNYYLEKRTSYTKIHEILHALRDFFVVECPQGDTIDLPKFEASLDEGQEKHEQMMKDEGDIIEKEEIFEEEEEDEIKIKLQ